MTAARVAIETTSSDLAVVVDRQTVNDLPINGRDFRQLLKMAPGIQAADNPGNLSVNGTRTNFINYQIDGVDNNDGSGNNIALNQGGVGNNPDVYLPIEAIDQLSIQSNAESDMGRNGGANANIVIKSGSNQFHGTLYEFNRNEALAARSPLLQSRYAEAGDPQQPVRFFRRRAHHLQQDLLLSEWRIAARQRGHLRPGHFTFGGLGDSSWRRAAAVQRAGEPRLHESVEFLSGE